jgi:hypothetical protein
MLIVAQGRLELGKWLETGNELDEISPQRRT